MANKKVILTGLRANNDLHIGNYFGALLPIIDIAKSRSNDYQVNLFIPDLHSFTTPIDHTKLQQAIHENLKVFVASGLPLDAESVKIYRQSYIPAHSELTWIMQCFTGVGQMNRMTQYKQKSNRTEINELIEFIGIQTEELVDKYNAVTESYKIDDSKLLGDNGDNVIEEKKEISYENLDDHMAHYRAILNTALTTTGKISLELGNIEYSEDNATTGLLSYPVLMAADILLYGAEYVPVGDDQAQHLEFTRDIAERMNSRFGELFTVPYPVKKQHEFFGKDQGLRIKDLQNPGKKMSKSADSDKGVVFLSDTPEIARKKIMSAETDSISEINYDPKNQPGISNLIDILALLDNSTSQKVADRYKSETQYGKLKTELADKMTEFLSSFQDSLQKVDEQAIQNKLESSEKQMNEMANKTLNKVQKAVGLR